MPLTMGLPWMFTFKCVFVAHLQEDSVACSKRGGLGSDLASLLGLIQSMTAWKLTIGRQY